MIKIKMFEEYLSLYEYTTSRTVLYHYTTLSSLYSILKSDTLKAREVYDSTNYEWRRISNKSISFTRQLLSNSELSGIQRDLKEKLKVIIVFDYQKLKNNYKIVPWNDNRIKHSQKSIFGENLSQFEERAITDIKNVKKYIFKIIILDSVDFSENNYINSGKYGTESLLPFVEFVNSENFFKGLYYFLKEKNIIYKINLLKKHINKDYNIFNCKIINILWLNFLFNKIKEMFDKIEIKKLSNISFTADFNKILESLNKEDIIKNFNRLWEDFESDLKAEEKAEMYIKKIQKQKDLI